LRIDNVNKPVFIQKLIAEFTVETLNERIIGRFSRPYMLNDNVPDLSPLMKDRTGKFWTVIRAYPLRIAV